MTARLSQSGAKVLGLHHTGFVVQDRDRAVEFYTKALGLQLVKLYERYGSEIDKVVGYDDTYLLSALLAADDDQHMIEVIQYVRPPPVDIRRDSRNMIGASHLALVIPNIQEVYDRVASSGGRTLNPPIELVPGRMCCYIQDPDCNWLELIMFVSE